MTWVNKNCTMYVMHTVWHIKKNRSWIAGFDPVTDERILLNRIFYSE